jgi:hypothetical protein
MTTALTVKYKKCFGTSSTGLLVKELAKRSRMVIDVSSYGTS